MGDHGASVGQIVHYVSGSQHLAAIITDPAYQTIEPAQYEPVVTQALTVFSPTQPPFPAFATFDPTGETPGTWHWPEYVSAQPAEPEE